MYMAVSDMCCSSVLHLKDNSAGDCARNHYGRAPLVRYLYQLNSSPGVASPPPTQAELKRQSEPTAGTGLAAAMGDARAAPARGRHLRGKHRIAAFQGSLL